MPSAKSKILRLGLSSLRIETSIRPKTILVSLVADYPQRVWNAFNKAAADSTGVEIRTGIPHPIASAAVVNPMERCYAASGIGANQLAEQLFRPFAFSPQQIIREIYGNVKIHGNSFLIIQTNFAFPSKKW